MERYLVAVLILCTIFSGCVSQSDYGVSQVSQSDYGVSQSNYEEIPINTFTSRRIMTIAADHIGVVLIREISAFKKVDEPWYIVNFEGRNGFGNVWTCNAKVHEPTIGRGYVTRWNCWWS
ncbi:uncharacterized protein LOC128545843 [Mercenaria mercenaria]|uniref:uncharacterized protein LOC128545843 n=1 Tax=Mercenaria mercenaria TaxID=6596 RepID=UPI001E1D3370|nr:uncharacterized protein LOC128545843 [Mercenaria mercenaria]